MKGKDTKTSPVASRFGRWVKRRTVAPGDADISVKRDCNAREGLVWV